MRNDIKRFFVAVLAACGLAVSAALAEPSYQARLTVQGYEGAELANFPVLVRLSSQTIKGFDGAECEADGSDLRFVSDTGDVYPHEIDTWVWDGESLVWVKLPQLAKGESFFVQWGGGTVESSNASGTWNDSYAGVWHMGEADGVCKNSTKYGSAYDATPKGNTANSVRYTGDDAPVGGARQTATSAERGYLSVPSYSTLGFGDTFTISGWIRFDGVNGYPRLFSRKRNYNEGPGWEIEMSNNSYTSFNGRGNNQAGINGTFPGKGFNQTWVHVAVVYSGATLTVYGDGALVKSGAITAADDVDYDLSFGCDSNGDEAYVRGQYDECRLMGGAASADWVKAEYDTVSNQGFLAYAEAESLAPDPTLRLTAFRSSAVADTSADFTAYVKGLGEGAASATLTLEYGFDAASLDRTQEVKMIDQAGRAEFSLSGLQPGRTYFVRLVVRNNLGESIESDVLRVKTAVVPEGFGEPGLNQTFFTRMNANWGKSYAELPPGTDWLNYQDGNRIYRRELGVLAAYVGGTPGASAKKRRSAVWGDEVYWPENSGQWVYWGKMHLEGGKSYLFRTHIDDCERVQVTDPRTGKTTTLIEDVTASGSIITSPKPFEPTETGWYPIEIRMGDNSGGAGGYTTTDDYLNTQNIGWSDDGGKTWNLMMDEGDGSLFMTGDSASVSVKEVISGGSLQRLDLTFPAASGPRDLRVVWGPVHGGNTLAGWSNTNHVATIAAGQTKATYSLPPNWGSADNLVLRFCLLDGARPVWSPSVYWRDVADPAVSLDALDGWMGDKLKVTGDLKDYVGGPCTLKVLVGPSEDEMTNAWTGAADFVRQSPGAFELTIFESNTSSPKYLAPGETYFVCIEAEAGGRRTRSQTKRVKMAGAPAFGSVSADVSRRTVTFRGRLTDVGMGDVATVSLWVGETSAEASLVQVETPIAVRDGEFEIVHTFPAFDRDYSWQLRASVTSGGGTATAETCTDVATCHTLDTTSYTWTGAADSDWGNPANWSDGEANGDSCGYPQSSAATVNFPAGTKARIVLSTATSVGTLNLAAAGTEVTFARAAGQEAEDAKPKLSVNNELLLSGARLRLVLDGVALESPGTSLSAFDGEVRLSNGASWNLGALSNDHGGRLLLDRGTSLTCADYVFGGGLTVIDDATLKVTSCVVLGSNMDGGTIRFVGAQPAFLCSRQDAMVRSGRETANVRLEFALPVGGYATPPFSNAFANPSYILGYNGNERREWPITVDIAPDSPAAFVDETTETTLISWGKGICSNIIQTAVQPGADATFVWSEENVSENPVSLGVRVVGSSHSDELHVKGEPESFPCESLSPGYGAVTVARDETRTCTAPADPVNVSETKRVTCVGWKLYSFDAASLTRTLVREGDGTSCDYTNTDGLWHELVWQWKVEYLVTATTDENGTASVTTDGNGTESVASAWVETGKRVRVTVTPNDGFDFGKWTGDMPADHDKDFELRFTVRDRAYAFVASFLPVVYVSPEGDDDNNDGKSFDTAFKTIGRALQEGPNVYVRLADGIYEVTEQIVIANGSTVAGATPGAKAVVKLMKQLSDREAPGSVFKLAHADARLYNLTVTTDYDRGDASQNAYGDARNGGFGRGVWIEQAGLVDGCVITNCRSLYCNGSGGGGVYLKKGGIVRRTLLTHNSTWGPNNGYAAKGHNALLDGGGLIESCRLVWGGGGETSETRCGGVYSNGGTVRNSLIACNTQVYDDPASGIAVHLIDGVMENCTVAGNFHLTSRRTPAVYAQNNDNSWTNDPVIRNCVIWGNTGAGADSNWGLEAGRCTVSNTCARPLMPGDGNGNIAADPCFANPRAGDFRLTLSSAVDAAVPMDWMDWTGDLDGNDRQQGVAPDMGCYEFAPSALSCGFDVSAGGAFDQDDITLTARVAGDDLTGLSYTWTLKDEWGNTIDERTTTETSLTLPLTSGLYTVVLSVKKGEETVGTVTRQDVVRVNQKNFYIATDGADEYPYDTVAKAARDFNTVLALAVDGAVIHVAPGWYRPADGLTVAKGVTIVADEGPEKTFLFAPMTTEYKAMVTVLHAGAVLSGLTVTGKGKVKDEDENETQPEYWGGLRVTAGVVTNCVISHHKTKKDTVSAGCRLEGGTVVDCTFTNNFCWFVGNAGTYGRGGAVTLEVGDALLDRCTVVSNRIANAQGAVTGDSYAYGGGVYLSVGTVRNSLVVGNESHAYGGGIAVKGTGRVLNCTVVGNAARLGSGGIWQDGGTVRDCLCLGNVAHRVVDVADDPGFVDAANGDYRLNPASAAVDAAEGTDLGGFDRAGRPRKSGSAVDKGCYEYERETSPKDFDISFRKLTPFAPGEVEFTAKAANGELRDCLWTFNGLEQMTGATVTRVCEPGPVSVSFSANLNGQPVAVDRPDWFVAYGETVHVVVSNENPVFPYATWDTAATNLSDAFAAVQRDGIILMGEGEYDLTERRTIDFPMTLRGANGPERTVLDAHYDLRPFQLRHPSAVLDGLTLRNGKCGQDQGGGGVAIRDGGQVTNCVFDACCGDIWSTGGVGVEGRGARILDCRFVGCWVDDDSNRQRKGVAISGGEDLLIDRCLVQGSHEGGRQGKNFIAWGDGAIYLAGGTVRNTIVTGSVLRGCGGIVADGTAKVENCTIVGNVSTNATETVAGLRIDNTGVKVYNTIAWDNRWTNGVSSVVKNVGGTGGYDSCLENCCTAEDPKLRGHGKFAFRPTSGSPCIDAGSKLSWMDETAVDIYGRPRKQGKRPDIGAAEALPPGFMILVR